MNKFLPRAGIGAFPRVSIHRQSVFFSSDPMRLAKPTASALQLMMGHGSAATHVSATPVLTSLNYANGVEVEVNVADHTGNQTCFESLYGVRRHE